MADDQEFLRLMELVRDGDGTAVMELVRRYEPQIRRVVRVRMTSPALRRELDSVDICQSVLGDFFVRAAVGQFEVNSPEQLIALLARMARNRLINHINHQHAARRDVRRLKGIEAAEFEANIQNTSPSQAAALGELLSLFRGKLTAI